MATGWQCTAKPGRHLNRWFDCEAIEIWVVSHTLKETHTIVREEGKVAQEAATSANGHTCRPTTYHGRQTHQTHRHHRAWAEKTYNDRPPFQLGNLAYWHIPHGNAQCPCGMHNRSSHSQHVRGEQPRLKATITHLSPQRAKNINRVYSETVPSGQNLTCYRVGQTHCLFLVFRAR